MTEAELLARHPCVARSGCEPLFSREVARAVVEDATAHRLAILGIEGVRLIDGKPLPDLGAILDGSDLLRLPWREAVRTSHTGAVAFLNRQPEGLLFSIVFAAEGEF